MIAMSGGVDSSVAALLTQNRGYDYVGCTMKLFDDPSTETARAEPFVLWKMWRMREVLRSEQECPIMCLILEITSAVR